MMLAHIVMEYEIKLEEEGKYPKNFYVGTALVPGEAKVLFRKRVTEFGA